MRKSAARFENLLSLSGRDDSHGAKPLLPLTPISPAVDQKCKTWTTVDLFHLATYKQIT
jgi:hypothetical protein